MDRNRQPEGLRLPHDLVADDEVEARVREICWQQLVKGDADPLLTVEWIVDEGLLDEPAAHRAFDAMLAARREQVAVLPQHPSNLSRAFAGLEELGILARQDFSCCGTCAHGEIWQERDRSRTWRGYVLFHTQDTETLVDSGETYLAYGVFLDAHLTEAEWNALDEAAQDERYAELTRALMDEARPVLEAEGLTFDWDGDLRRRIRLADAEYFAPLG